MKNHKTQSRSELQVDELLSAYRNQRGVYANVAAKLGVDASYVSRVANGHRQSKAIRSAIAQELSKVQKNTVSKPKDEYLKCPKCGSVLRVKRRRK